jgi:thiamine kinase-like enzyme
MNVAMSPARAPRPVDSGGDKMAEDLVPDSVSVLLGSVPVFRSATRLSISPLLGGLTNHNYKVATGDNCYVARLSSPTSELLSIDREAEYRNSCAAAATGIAPAVMDYLPSSTGDSVLVIQWVEGRTWSSADVRSSANLPRIAAACRQLHSGPRFINDFNMFDIQRGYLEIVLQRRFRLPERYLEFTALVAEVEAALAVHPEPTVPCHNDLLAENFIDDSSTLWLIDYEYAGNNEPSFELGNIASESGLDADAFGELVRCYYGDLTPAKLARARLWALMSQYGWTLWAAIQDSVSELDFDFWSWGMEKFRRAVATFDGGEFAQLLLDVRQPE